MKDFKLSYASLSSLIDVVNTLLKSGKVYRVQIKEWRETRSLSQNNLLHLWMGELSAFLISKGRKQANPEFCKELMKHTFLGYVEVERVSALTGEVTTHRQLRHTSQLDTGEMFSFMCKVQCWCVDKGLFLTIPESSEFYQLNEKANG